MVGRLHIAGGENSILHLNLPSTEKGPAPSPEVILEEESELQPAAFMPYEIPTLALAPDLALDTLLALPDHPPHAVAYGGVLRYWVTAARFAYELIARQCYMPSLQESKQAGETSLRAAWTAVFAPEDDERERTLALMMPPLQLVVSAAGPKRKLCCPALCCIISSTRPSMASCVATSPRSTGLVPFARRRHAGTLTLSERWLQALSTEDPTLDASSAETRQFVTAVQTWLGQVRPGEKDAPFRTCFRLDPPSPEDGHEMDWRVELLPPGQRRSQPARSGGAGLEGALEDAEILSAASRAAGAPAGRLAGPRACSRPSRRACARRALKSGLADGAGLRPSCASAPLLE